MGSDHTLRSELGFMIPILLVIFLGGVSRPPQIGEWRVYASDAASSKYSPLTQIDASNVSKLRVTWRWSSVDNDLMKRRPDLKPGPNESTPLMVGGVLYTSTGLGQVAALAAATGKRLWVHNPESYGSVHRGVAY